MSYNWNGVTYADPKYQWLDDGVFDSEKIFVFKRFLESFHHEQMIPIRRPN